MALETGKRIGRDQLVGVADMRLAVRIGDRSRDVEFFAGHERTNWCADCGQIAHREGDCHPGAISGAKGNGTTSAPETDGACTLIRIFQSLLSWSRLIC